MAWPGFSLALMRAIAEGMGPINVAARRTYTVPLLRLTRHARRFTQLSPAWERACDYEQTLTT
jgi:hypothetical protein